MIVTVFRSRLNQKTLSEYQDLANRLSQMVREIPGYISHKSYEADDEERVTIVEFDSEESLKNWAIHPDHVGAKKLGRSALFTDYRVQICEVIRDSFNRKSKTTHISPAA